MKAMPNQTKTPFFKRRFLQDLGFIFLAEALIMLAMPGSIELPILAWIALVPIMFLLSRPISIKRALILGGIFGSFFWLISNLWFLDTDPWQRAGWFVVTLIWGPAQFSWLFALLTYLKRKSNTAFLLSFPLLWIVSSYFVREKLFSNPIMNLAETQYQSSNLIQAADVGGIYLISLVILLVNVAVFIVLNRFRKGLNFNHSEIAICSLALILLILSFGYGLVRNSSDSNFWDSEPADNLSILVVQPDFRYEYGKDPDVTERIEELKRLTRSSLNQREERPDLIVWPETVTPEYIFAESQSSPDQIRVVKEELALNIVDFHKETDQIPLMFGGFLTSKEWPEPPITFYNTMFFLTNGENLQRYNKNNPLFIVETAPKAIVNLTRSAGLKSAPNQGQKIRGETPSDFSLDGVKFGVLICSENSITSLARHHEKEGAQFFLNPNDNSSLDSTWAVQQHAAVSRFRAIENRRYFLSAGNVGPSELINPKGEVVNSLVAFEKNTILVDIPVYGSLEQTFYTRFGNIVVWLSLIGTLVAVFYVQKIQKRK